MFKFAFQQTDMDIFQTNNTNYCNAITALYLEAFSSGKSTQYINAGELSAYITSFFVKGIVTIATENEQLIGALLACPITLDTLLPKEIENNFEIDKCLYIAEMMVSEQVRGKGIGTLLIQHLLKETDRQLYKEVFIRVWDENIPALHLYRKMGFNDYCTIQQTKMKADGTGTFVMPKIYLHQKLE